MPLVIICGHPCSGKTTCANALRKYIEEEKGRDVMIISDDSLHLDRNESYMDIPHEKNARSSLRSAVQRYLTKDTVVILDSLNFIKGYRYELYCLAREVGTNHCVIHCSAPAEKCEAWNAEKTGPKYSNEVFKDLIGRFEPPNANNRWDSPLFIVDAGDTLACKDVADVLLEGKTYRPSYATRPQVLQDTNWLHEMDSVIQGVIAAVTQAQKTGMLGSVVVPKCETQVELTRPITMPELRRIRQQFVHMMKKRHGVQVDIGSIGNLFVAHLNMALQS